MCKKGILIRIRYDDSILIEIRPSKRAHLRTWMNDKLPKEFCRLVLYVDDGVLIKYDFEDSGITPTKEFFFEKLSEIANLFGQFLSENGYSWEVERDPKEEYYFLIWQDDANQ